MASAAVGEVLLGRYRVEAVRVSFGSSSVGDGVDARTGAPVRLYVVDLVDPAVMGVDPARVLADAERFRIGAEGIARSQGVGLEAARPGETARLVVAYERNIGSPLAELLGSGVEPERAAKLLHELARALVPLHEQGIAHGWLVPDAIVLTSAGMRLEAFGLEPCLRTLAGARAVVASLPAELCAPERAGAPGPATPSDDVFAFGVLARQLLGARANAEVEALLAPATSRSPVGRPDDLVRFAESLEKALAGGAAVAPEPEPEAELPTVPRTSAPPEPTAAPEPEAAPAPAPEPLPPRFEPAPRSARSKQSLLSIVALLGGLVLIVVAMGGIFVYALVRPSPSSTAASPVEVVDAGATEEADAASPDEPPPPDAGAPRESEAEDDAGDAGVATLEPDAAVVRAPPLRLSSSDDASGLLPVAPDVPLWGSPKALVTIVMFGDLECPHTRSAYAVLEALMRAFPDDLRIAFRHRPLASHPHARDAARVAAGLRREKGDAAFWRFVSEVSRGTWAADRKQLETWVERAGGDPSHVATYLTERDTDAEVSRDMVLAGIFDVRETPTFFIDGLRVEGYQTLDGIKPLVERELSAARGLSALGTALGDLYVARVRKNLIGIGSDVVSRTCPSVTGSPMRGASDALVTIVEFSDFECPFCRRVQPTLDTLMARFGGDVRVVWKNFPLDFHRDARPAAAFALEAFERGGSPKFWKVHDLLFDAQGHLDETHFGAIASQAGLDPTALLDAARTKTHDPKIDADARLGKKLGVNGTPTFFVNGRMLTGAQPLERFQAVVREEIDGAKRLVASGTPRSRVYDVVCGAH